MWLIAVVRDALQRPYAEEQAEFGSKFDLVLGICFLAVNVKGGVPLIATYLLEPLHMLLLPLDVVSDSLVPVLGEMVGYSEEGLFM